MRDLPLDNSSGGRYSNRAGINLSAGFSSLITHADNRRHYVMRYFYARNKPRCALIMVGRSGEASAPAGFMSASLLTLLRLATPFSSGLVRLTNFTHEAPAMVATPAQTHPEFIRRFYSCQKRSTSPFFSLLSCISAMEVRHV